MRYAIAVLFLGLLFTQSLLAALPPDGTPEKDGELDADWIGSLDLKVPMQLHLQKAAGASEVSGRYVEANSTRKLSLAGPPSRIEISGTDGESQGVLALDGLADLIRGKWTGAAGVADRSIFAVRMSAASRRVDVTAEDFKAGFVGRVENTEYPKQLFLERTGGHLRGESVYREVVLNLDGDVKPSGAVALREVDDAGTLVGSFLGTFSLQGYFQGKYQDPSGRTSVPAFFVVSEAVSARRSASGIPAGERGVKVSVRKRHLKTGQGGGCSLASYFPQVELPANPGLEQKINRILKTQGAATLIEEKEVSACGPANFEVVRDFKVTRNEKGRLGIEFEVTRREGPLGKSSVRSRKVLLRTEEG